MHPFGLVSKCHLLQKFGNYIYVVLPSTTGIASAKQSLHWTVPKLSTPEQCQRWSDLMPLVTWQLWLAKDLVREIRLHAAKVSL
jgi:hypothetical protein